MYKCVFGENLVKIAPQELLVAAEATPQSWQASQTSVWLGLNTINGQKVDILNVQSQFSGPKINLFFLKTIFLSKYQIWRTNNINKIFNFNIFLEKFD